MKIAVMSVGTRGDVQPYVALARGLQRAGHEPLLVTASNFEGFVREAGVPFFALRADYYELINSDEGKAILKGNPLKIMQTMKQTIFPLMRNLIDDSWMAAQGMDAIIFHPKIIGAPHIGEKLHIPVFPAATVPLTPTSAFPAPGIPNLGGWFNKFSYSMVQRAASFFDGMIKEWRVQTLGLPSKSSVVEGYKLRSIPTPTLYCYSKHVLPVPSDWDDGSAVTGYWILNNHHDWQPPRELLAFLDKGPAPVYVGFGSMVAHDPRKLTETVIAALDKAGVRGVLATGWGGMKAADMPENVFLLNEAPHEWLFPRMSAVVHHGGAGTVAAGLRAGKPTLVCPFIADQPFWGRILEQQGLGPKPLSQRQMTVDKLAEAIRSATQDKDMRVRAERVGELLRAEDGVDNAIAIIERTLKTVTAVV
jgi:sterol 3beta-glucosyltransferase